MPTQRSFQEYLAFLRKVENGPKVGFDKAKGKWLPHQDPSGLWTIGHGILIGDGSSPDQYKDGLSVADEERLFAKAVVRAGKDAQRVVTKKFGAGAWESMDPRRRQMVTDFAFNLGPKFAEPSFKRGGRTITGFPKFTAAVVAGDEKKMAAESYRFGTREDGITVYPLEGRIRESDKFFYDGRGVLKVEFGRQIAERATKRRQEKRTAQEGESAAVKVEAPEMPEAPQLKMLEGDALAESEANFLSLKGGLETKPKAAPAITSGALAGATVGADAGAEPELKGPQLEFADDAEIPEGVVSTPRLVDEDAGRQITAKAAQQRAAKFASSGPTKKKNILGKALDLMFKGNKNA